MTLPENIEINQDSSHKTRPDSFLLVALLSALLASGIALYLFWQNQQLSYQLSLSRQVITSPSPSPSLIASPTTLPTTSPATSTKLMYVLPTGWASAKIPGSSISIGYDPAQFRTSLDGKFLTYNYVTSPGSFTFSQEQYDGGSRHSFIYQQQGYTSTPVSERMEGYHEKEYLVNGWNCLVLYRLSYSAAGTTWGMCPISSSQALYFGGPSEEKEMEQILSTLK